MFTVSAHTRRELARAARERYLASSSAEKRRILDEFVALTGYHRKHAIRVLRSRTPAPVSTPPRPRVYDEVVRQALEVLWDASDRICGKRLKPLLPILIPALERHGRLSLDDAVRRQLLAVSAATIDRLLAGTRAAAQGHRRRRRAQPHVAQRMPRRRFAGRESLAPGYFELDLVAHCGDNAAGSFVWTLVLTDIASGWIERVALLAGRATFVIDGLERLRNAMPLPLRGIDLDTGGGPLNDTVRAYCGVHQIEVTRSRPRRGDDHGWLAQDHGPPVRCLAGHGRLEGPRAVEILERLYTASRRFENFFQPSFRLADKKRVGARVIKRYHPPETPCARLLASPAIDEAGKQLLRTVLVTLDPLRLLDDIRTEQQHLAGIATHGVAHEREEDLDRFVRTLAAVRREAEVRPAPRSRPAPPRPWRTREDPFDGVWPQVVSWLEAEPDQTAKALLQRLQAAGLGTFPDRGLRTLQRRVKEWRRTRPVRP